MKQLRYSCPSCARWFEFDAGADENFSKEIDCPFCDDGKAVILSSDAPSSKTGCYKYSKKLHRTIKVSDAVPGVSGGGGKCASCSGGSCSCCH